MRIHDLAKASAAEDFFLALGVAYDQGVLDVHRLHILHRFRGYLAASSADGRTPAATRDCLERAYADFAGTTPPPARAFKVFQGAPALVPLTALRRQPRD